MTTQIEDMTSKELVDFLASSAHLTGRAVKEASRRLGDVIWQDEVRQVANDFIAEGSAVYGPIFQPQPVTKRRQALINHLEAARKAAEKPTKKVRKFKPPTTTGKPARQGRRR